MISPGSQWHRWEPHIHAPGTVLNDRFGGGDPWDVYLTKIETKTPLIRALAVTDYYLTDLYEQVLQHKEDGRLPHVDLIFPNIEMGLYPLDTTSGDPYIQDIGDRHDHVLRISAAIPGR